MRNSIKQYLTWNHTLLCAFLLFIPNYQTIKAAPSVTIRSSVSEEFRQGVHEQYLNYLAEKLDFHLEILPMTYNRRLASLKDGTIDMMAGVRSTYATNDKFVYLQPAHSISRNSFFIRAEDGAILKSDEDLNGLTIAITADEKSHVNELESLGVKVVVIPSLKQKILLLEKKRIDAFEHVEASGLSYINENQLDERISLAQYKSKNALKFHFALHINSPLMKYKTEIESVIAKGVSAGDFTAIREGHYKSKDN